jgi:hypothetical protein
VFTSVRASFQYAIRGLICCFRLACLSKAKTWYNISLPMGALINHVAWYSNSLPKGALRNQAGRLACLGQQRHGTTSPFPWVV